MSKGGIRFIVISYVPLLAGDAGVTLDPDDAPAIVQFMDSLPDGCADGCIWFMDDGVPCPVFVMPGAREIADHLAAWSEGSPADWFDLHVKSRGEKYAVVLMPRIQKSVDRFGIAYHLRTGYPVPHDASYSILFKPLRFSTGSSLAFRGVRKLIGRTSLLGLIDPADLHPTDISKTDPAKVRMVGPFQIGPNKGVEAYLDGLLDVATKPPPSALDRYRPG